SLLGFGNGDFRSVQARIFFRHLVQVDLQSGCQFSDGNRYTARTEVVTFFDQKADLSSAEKSLQFTLGRRISFLYLCAAGLDGLCGVYLGGTGSSAAAVTAGTSAQQDDDIARIGIFTDNSVSWRRSENCSDLHTFCHIVWMINFFYISGSQTDLVSVGAVSVSRLAYQFLLRKFSFQGFALRTGRVCRTGHTHCLVHISTS